MFGRVVRKVCVRGGKHEEERGVCSGKGIGGGQRGTLGGAGLTGELPCLALLYRIIMSYETKASTNYYGVMDSKAYQKILRFQPYANSTFLNKICNGSGIGEVISDVKKAGLSSEDETRFMKAMNAWYDEVMARRPDHYARIAETAESFGRWYSNNKETFNLLDEIASLRKDAMASANKKRKADETQETLDKRDAFEAAVEEFKLACLSGDRDEISRTEKILRSCGP